MSLTLTPAVVQSLTLSQTLSITALTQTSSVAVGSIAAGTTVARLTSRGDLIMGPNVLGASDSSTFDPDHNVADFAYYATSRKILSRSMVLREVGDATEFQMGRAGGTYPDTPLGAQSTEGQSIYWTFYTTPIGGTPGVTSGGKFPGISEASAGIVVRLQENAMNVVGGTNSGGDLRIQTRATGSTAAPQDRIVVRANGQVGVLGSSGSAGDFDSYARGDLAVEGRIIAKYKQASPVELLPDRRRIWLTGRGITSETIPAGSNAATLTPTSQTVYIAGLGLAQGDVATSVTVCVSTAAVGTTPTGMYLGLYNTSGTLLASTANLNADAKWTSTGNKTFAFSSPYTVTADGLYYVAFLQNGAFGTTQPQIIRGANVTPWAAAISPGGRAYGNAGTGQATLPGTAVLADDAVCIWAAIS